jgi:hypothetical protein
MKNRREFIISGASAVGLLALSKQAKSGPQQAPAYLKVASGISQTGMASIRSFLHRLMHQIRTPIARSIYRMQSTRVQLFIPAGVYNVSPNPDSPEIKNAQSKGGSCINLLPGAQSSVLEL